MYGIGGELNEQLAKLGDGEKPGRARGWTVSGFVLGDDSKCGLGVWVKLCIHLSIIIYL